MAQSYQQEVRSVNKFWIDLCVCVCGVFFSLLSSPSTIQKQFHYLNFRTCSESDPSCLSPIEHTTTYPPSSGILGMLFVDELEGTGAHSAFFLPFTVFFREQTHILPVLSWPSPITGPLLLAPVHSSGSSRKTEVNVV